MKRSSFCYLVFISPVNSVGGVKITYKYNLDVWFSFCALLRGIIPIPEGVDWVIQHLILAFYLFYFLWSVSCLVLLVIYYLTNHGERQYYSCKIEPVELYGLVLPYSKVFCDRTGRRGILDGTTTEPTDEKDVKGKILGINTIQK